MDFVIRKSKNGMHCFGCHELLTEHSTSWKPQQRNESSYQSNAFVGIMPIGSIKAVLEFLKIEIREPVRVRTYGEIDFFCHNSKNEFFLRSTNANN